MKLIHLPLIIFLLGMDSVTHYSVRWPHNWITNDLTDSDRNQFPFKVESFVGGRPKGQVKLYQHAILESSSPKAAVIKGIIANIALTNSTMTERRIVSLDGREADMIVKTNKVDKNNVTPYLIQQRGSIVYILDLHSSTDPKSFYYESSQQLIRSFQAK